VNCRARNNRGDPHNIIHTDAFVQTDLAIAHAHKLGLDSRILGVDGPEAEAPPGVRLVPEQRDARITALGFDADLFSFAKKYPEIVGEPRGRGLGDFLQQYLFSNLTTDSTGAIVRRRQRDRNVGGGDAMTFLAGALA